MSNRTVMLMRTPIGTNKQTISYQHQHRHKTTTTTTTKPLAMNTRSAVAGWPTMASSASRVTTINASVWTRIASIGGSVPRRHQHSSSTSTTATAMSSGGAESPLGVHVFFDSATNTLQYVVVDATSKKCAIIDSVLDFDEKAGRTSSKSCDELLQFVAEHALSVEWILDTHAHADHLTGAQYLKRKLGGAVQYGIGAHIVDVQSAFKPIYDLHELKTDGSQFDRLFLDGDVFHIGALAVRVLHTPGHTPACVSYVVNDEAVFVGDTFFAPDAGTARCDFPNGSAATLWSSLHKLLALPDATAVYLCHDYMPNGRQLVYRTSIGEERSKNIHIAGKDEAAYVKLREERDKTLAVPKLLLPSIQVNVDGGNLPQPKAGDKHAHLKLPLNVI